MKRLPALTLLGAVALPAAAQQKPNENDYYRMVTVPVPERIVLEVGGLAPIPDGRLAVSTRRGDVWMIENPTMEGGDAPHFTRFARGLHEALGLAWKNGALYAAQRGELTRLRDTDGDGRADRYETVFSWPLSGNYHEYSFGPVFAPNGGDDMIVTLNLAWIGRGASLARWRGWTIQVTPDGKMTPIATGMRSPAGVGYNLAGDLFYSENQGDWVGSGFIAHVQRGDFTGNPEGLKWTGEPGSPLTLKPDDVPDTGEPKYEVAKRVPALKTPAVWFPHTIMGISTSGILVDSTRGKFGPFAGQLFVGDEGQSKVMRVFLEKVDGVYQGAVFPFRDGFMSGVLREAWGADGSMFVGMTNRGWPSTGKAPYGLQRLVWTGKVPFEPHRVEARPDGFEITFTSPADRATASDPASYAVSGFTYKYHHVYGSPPIEQQTLPVRYVALSPDGLHARVVVDGLRLGFIHEIRMAGVRSPDGQPLVHDVGYYTLNRIPAGERLAVAARAATTPVTKDASRAEASRPLTPTRPRPVPLGRVDASLAVSAEPGLKFSTTRLEAAAGSRVGLVLDNAADMPHNLVIVAPGRADAVHEASMKMGLAGAARDYAPATGDVLFHTRLIEPGKSDTLVFRAPAAPGDYPFLCTFPGHGAVMRGVLHVTP